MNPLKMVTKTLDPILSPVLSPLKIIIDAMLKIIELIVILLTYIPELLTNFLNVLNPINILNDTILGIFLSFQILIRNIGSVFRREKQNNNSCKDTGSGIFGYRREKNENGKIVKNNNSCKRNNSKCIKPSLFRIIIAVLCPPLAMFLHFGISGWFHVIISAILTVYFYYFPGLIYVLLHTLSYR